METVRTLDALPGVLSRLGGRGTVVTIGVFDGLHLGHQELIRRNLAVARDRGLLSVILTFTAHPLTVLAPPYAPGKLIYADRKEAILSAMGVDVLAHLDFTHEFAAQVPRDFLRESVAGLRAARVVVCGYDFAFGKDGAGNAALLREVGPAAGFETVIVDAVGEDGVHIKSTMVRDLVLHGRVSEARRMLARPYELRGTVGSGFGRGRQIGFPTANLLVDPGHVIPGRGVYAGTARVHPDGPMLGAMINIGTSPTFGADRFTVEAHLIEFSGDLVGKVLELHFLDRLRDERKFESVEALVDQLHRDRVVAVGIVGQGDPDRD